MIADRHQDEVEWLRDCARWLAQLELGSYPPVVNMHPDIDRERYNVVVDAARLSTAVAGPPQEALKPPIAALASPYGLGPRDDGRLACQPQANAKRGPILDP